MDRNRLFALVATILVVAVAAAGAGWKWGCGPHAVGHERLAGWTWDAPTPDPPGNGHEKNP
jgi:hypothetical protein